MHKDRRPSATPRSLSNPQVKTLICDPLSSSYLSPGDLDLPQAFFEPIQNTLQPSPYKRRMKMAVVGVGDVGMAVAQNILTYLADELALVDAKPDKVRGEMLDVDLAAAFLSRAKASASCDNFVAGRSMEATSVSE